MKECSYLTIGDSEESTIRFIENSLKRKIMFALNSK